MVLYAVWILPEIVGVRNTALVVGALTGIYPIYQYRALLLTKRAIPIWLIFALFIWATFHLIFLSQDYAAQLLEYKRIWKYAAIGAVFAFGLGLSLMSATLNQDKSKQASSAAYWRVILFGLSTPVLIYLLKYVLVIFEARWGIQIPSYLQIPLTATRYYIPKTDYVAFCLPLLAVALGQIQTFLLKSEKQIKRERNSFFVYSSVISATLFLFYIQNIKNGFAYASFCFGLFFLMLLFSGGTDRLWKKLFYLVFFTLLLSAVIFSHAQKNDSWRTLVVDTRVAFQLEKYQHWKYAGEKGYPNNELGRIVSVTNYERAAWFMVGLKLAKQSPLGFGLVEDSFKHMAKNKWPDVSSNLSHSHSGWLDIILAIGIPGFTLIISALLLVIKQSKHTQEPWNSLVFWGLFAIGVLWITTEVSATVTFAALIFWLSWAAGLTLAMTTIKPKRSME